MEINKNSNNSIKVKVLIPEQNMVCSFQYLPTNNKNFAKGISINK